MKRFLLILLAGLLTPSGLYAQKVYKQDGKAILDMTTAAGMPANAVTDVPKTWTDTPSNSGGPMANNTESGSINAKVYQKLEISQADRTSSSWADAFTGCKGWTHNGSTGWRLPTQRELQMIYIFRKALNIVMADLGGTNILAQQSWAATENTSTASWSVYLENGLTTNLFNKTDSQTVRCVREVSATVEPTCGTGGVAVAQTIGANSYLTHMYGGKCWMVENSREVIAHNSTYVSSTTYESNTYTVNASANGYYYTWQQATMLNNACPNGWRLPDQDELIALQNEVEADLSGKGKWWAGPQGATNGAFAASRGNEWAHWGSQGYWWSSSATPPNYFEYLVGFNSGMLQPKTNTDFWMSVRCVRD